jgi:pimeloyl-ACP methyl ester carboxylesterase
MSDTLYLHGFFQPDPESSVQLQSLRRANQDTTIHAPSYHPDGDVSATRIGATLDECAELIIRSRPGRAHVIGFSFGGLLAALLAEQHPELVTNVLLLAPAIDNFARNYEGRTREDWFMPESFVEEILRYPARPRITRPTTVVHGLLDNDTAGCSPWRIKRWAEEQRFENIYFLPNVPHSMEPWISADKGSSDEGVLVPTFPELVRALVGSKQAAHRQP